MQIFYIIDVEGQGAVWGLPVHDLRSMIMNNQVI